jgi:hypothetical protein
MSRQFVVLDDLLSGVKSEARRNFAGPYRTRIKGLATQ